MIKRIFSYFGQYKKFVFIGVACVLVDVLCEIMIPTIQGNIIDIGIAGSDRSYIIKWSVIMVLLGLAAIAAGSSNSYFTSRSSQGMGANLRQAVFDGVQNFSFSNIDKFSTASLVTRSTSDVNTIQMATMMSLRLLVRAPLMLVFALWRTVSISMQLTPILLVAVPVMVVLVLIVFRKVNPLFEIAQKKLDVLSRTVQENSIGQRVVKAFVRRAEENKKFDVASGEVMENTLRALSIMMSIMPIMMLVMNGAVIAALWFGGQQVMIGGLGIGQLNAFISYAMQILISLMMISMILIMVARSRVSAERVFEVLDTTPDIQDPANGRDETPENGEVRFDHVNFHYDTDGSGETLADINFVARSGEVIAVVSSTGGGKSTMVNLIPRLYDVDNGSVSVGGHDVRDYKLDTLRDAIGVVLQKNVLFSGSIADNIRWGKPDATEEEVVAACKAAQAHDFIMSFPEGYDTHIEQGGSNVSGGQRQRLCIARALVKKPRVLILDDSTSAVDTATEAKIQEAFRRELEDTTVFLVAQRISSVRGADKIVVLDDGRVSGIGTHEELLKTNRIYQEINRSQNEEVA